MPLLSVIIKCTSTGASSLGVVSFKHIGVCYSLLSTLRSNCCDSIPYYNITHHCETQQYRLKCDDVFGSASSVSSDERILHSHCGLEKRVSEKADEGGIAHQGKPVGPTSKSLHPRVRSLYKECITMARLHPTFPMSKCRRLIKERFMKNSDIAVYVQQEGIPQSNDDSIVSPNSEEERSNSEPLQSHSSVYTSEFRRALAWGRFNLAELEALIHIHKFRSMKKRYDWSPVEKSGDVTDSLITSMPPPPTT
eukprot:Tbor_TRINITY_DN5849_c5_g1::TRINITY_DN5849_c5_g1_i1::g.6032::m.6032